MAPRVGSEREYMTSQLLFSGVIFGLSLASIYFLISIGLSLCFGLMRIISLDQLLYYTIGAYITYSLSVLTGSLWLGVLGGIVVGALLALAVERARSTEGSRIRDALEKLPPFSGAVRDYKPAFTATRHDAFDSKQVLFVRVGLEGTLTPTP